MSQRGTRQALEQERAISTLLAGGMRDLAVTRAIEAYGPALFGYLLAVIHDEVDARETLAQVCENMWKAIDRFAPGTSFRAWIYRIAWNAAQDRFRDRRVRRERRLDTGDAERLAAAPRSTTPLHLRSSIGDRVAALRQALAPDEQTLITLRVDRELTWSEIAEVLAEGETPVAEAALRKRFERVKRKLRRLAAEAGVVPP